METIKFSKEDIEEITKHRSTLESLIKIGHPVLLLSILGKW